MTKHAFILLTVFCQLLFSLNSFTNAFATAVKPYEERNATKHPSAILLGSSLGTEKLHQPYRILNSSPESSHHDYANEDEEFDGGKSIAFLRLGRSSEEDQAKEEDIRKEIDSHIKLADTHHKHHITKRSEFPQNDEDNLNVDPPENNHQTISSLPYDDTEEENNDLNANSYLSSLPDSYEKRNSFNLRPMKKNNFAFRPMKRNNFAFRPMRRSNFAFRPMKRNNFAFRPMKRSNFAFRPMKRNGDSFALRPVKKDGKRFSEQPRENNFLRFGKRDSFAFRPMKREGSFAFRPMKREGGSFVLRPMKRDSSNYLGSILDNAMEKKTSFSFRPMKKDKPGFQQTDFKDEENLWRGWRPLDVLQSLEDYHGMEPVVK